MKITFRKGVRPYRFLLGLSLACIVALPACRSGRSDALGEAPPAQAEIRKTAVLLVNHGSRSARWRSALLSLEERVRGPILENGKVERVTTAFMEYTEPSIATRLKELDRDGFTDIVLVPVLLTVSPHSFEDIPTIIGQKEDPRSLQMLKLEGIERYTPRARVHGTPLLDFAEMLDENITRRVRALSENPEEEGLVLVAYGDETYEAEWDALLASVADHIRKEVGIDAYARAWCGHVVRYDPKKTASAIEEVLKTKERALVVPVLVAEDEMFQVQIIGDGIAKVERADERVRYKPDALLPDPKIDEWVVRIVKERTEAMAASDGEAS